MVYIRLKYCNKCGLVKEETEFYKRKGGFWPRCKDCLAKYHADRYKKGGEKIRRRNSEYRKNNKEKIAEIGKRYIHNNKEEVAKWRAKYKAVNKEEIAKKNKVYREKNRENIAKWHADYYKKHKIIIAKRIAKYRIANRDKANIITAKYRASKKNQTPVLTQEEKDKIARYYEVAKRLGTKDFHVDHIHPISKGGQHHPDNLQILTVEDNMRKSDRLDYKPSMSVRI